MAQLVALDWRSGGCWYEPHWRRHHGIVSLSKTLYQLITEYWFSPGRPVPTWLKNRWLGCTKIKPNKITTGAVTVVSLSKTLYPLLSTGSTQEGRKLSWHDWKIVHWDKEHQSKQEIHILVKLWIDSHDNFIYIWQNPDAFFYVLYNE